MGGRRRGMIERQFEKSKGQKGRDDIEAITRVITSSLICNPNAAAPTEQAKMQIPRFRYVTNRL
jgi:hypothetical protein